MIDDVGTPWVDFCWRLMRSRWTYLWHHDSPSSGMRQNAPLAHRVCRVRLRSLRPAMPSSSCSAMAENQPFSGPFLCWAYASTAQPPTPTDRTPGSYWSREQDDLAADVACGEASVRFAD